MNIIFLYIYSGPSPKQALQEGRAAGARSGGGAAGTLRAGTGRTAPPALLETALGASAAPTYRDRALAQTGLERRF